MSPRAPLKPCAQPGCPNLSPKSRCPIHRREAEQTRGTRQQRGYDRDYDRQHRAWEPRVQAGQVDCWRCLRRIGPGTRWTLGHDDQDRSVIRGPEHEFCGLSAAGKASHGIPPGA